LKGLLARHRWELAGVVLLMMLLLELGPPWLAAAALFLVFF
jgi:hypothetical protein